MAKTSTDRGKANALDASLRKMFRSLEGRPTPSAVTSLVDQLDAHSAPQLRKAG